MRSVVWMVLVSAWLPACWTSSQAPPPAVSNTAPPHAPRPRAPAPDAAPLTEAERAEQAFTRFADRMCACPDTACAQAVSTDMTAWATDQAKASASMGKLDDAQMKRFEEVARRLTDCMMKAMGAGPPGPDAGP